MSSKEIRQASFIAPECMPAHRRARLTLNKLGRQNQKGCECVSYSVWIAPNEHQFINFMRDLNYFQALSENLTQENKQALEMVFCFRIPTLGHPIIWDLAEKNNQQVSQWKDYWQPYFIETVLPKDGGWMCFTVMDVIEKNGTTIREICNELNPEKSKTCFSCQANRPSMRPFFVHLQHISPVLSRERKEFLHKLEQLDTELTQYEKAITRADDATAMSSDRRELNKSEGRTFKSDVNLIQQGVWQRVETSTVLPLLLAHKSRVAARLVSTWGKLCLLVLYIYELCTPHIQRVVRGHLIRSRRFKFEQIQKLRVDLHGSVRLQQAFRQRLSCIHVENLRTQLRHNVSIKIQALSRKKLASFVFSRIVDKFRSHLNDIAITLIQKLIRSHNVIKHGRKFIAELVKQKEECKRIETMRKLDNNSLAIQLMYRSIVARERLNQKRVENQLHGQLAMHLKKCLSRGDLWSFLIEVNNDYRRYESIIDEILERESIMANTFVSKVIVMREEEHHRAWEEYDKAKQKKKKCDLHPPVGALKRSLWPSSVSTNAYVSKNKTKEQTAVYAKQDRHKCHQNSTGKIRHVDLNGIRKIPCSTSHTEVKVPSIAVGNSSGDQMLRYYNPTETALDIERIRQEIPNGLNDTILVFFRAASLRSILPIHLPSGIIFNKAEDAYAHYLTLSSHCPEKICFEKEAWDYAEPFAHQLMIRFNAAYIRQLLPQSKRASLLNTLKPSPIADFNLKCEKVLRSLFDCPETNVLSGGRCAQELKRVNIQNPNANDIFQLASLSHVSSHNDHIHDQHLDNSGLWGSIVVGENTDEACPVSKKANGFKHTLKRNIHQSWVAPFAAKTVRDACLMHPVYDQFRVGAQLAIDYAPSFEDSIN